MRGIMAAITEEERIQNVIQYITKSHNVSRYTKDSSIYKVINGIPINNSITKSNKPCECTSCQLRQQVFNGYY